MNNLKVFKTAKYIYMWVLNISLFLFYFPFGFGLSCFGCSVDQIDEMLSGKIVTFLVPTDHALAVSTTTFYFKIFLIILASSIFFIIWSYNIQENRGNMKKIIMSFYGQMFATMFALILVSSILFNF